MAKVLKQGSVADFDQYLISQLKMPYLWGGQHTLLTKENYKSVIDKKEKTATNRKKVIEYCEKMFAEGYDVLYGYDCSGLGTHYMWTLKGLISGDTTADGLRHMCDEVSTAKHGYFIFKQAKDKDGDELINKARHIGYMVSDTELIHAAGEGRGMERIKYKKSDWWKIGKPKMFKFDDEPKPTPPEPKPTTDSYVEVLGNVRVRVEPQTGKVIYTARKGEKLPYLDYTAVTKENCEWYYVQTPKGNGFISAFTNRKRKYTRLVIV